MELEGSIGRDCKFTKYSVVIYIRAGKIILLIFKNNITLIAYKYI